MHITMVKSVSWPQICCRRICGWENFLSVSNSMDLDGGCMDWQLVKRRKELERCIVGEVLPERPDGYFLLVMYF